jgi:CheY-like chemotaxis protein
MAGTLELRALVIDDEPAVRALLVDLLTLIVGVETVDVAASGAAASPSSTSTATTSC